MRSPKIVKERFTLKLDELSPIEKRTYEFIKEKGEVTTKRLPDRRMLGAVASLRDKGLVEIQRKYSSIYRKKKKKFVRLTNPL